MTIAQRRKISQLTSVRMKAYWAKRRAERGTSMPYRVRRARQVQEEGGNTLHTILFQNDSVMLTQNAGIYQLWRKLPHDAV